MRFVATLNDKTHFIAQVYIYWHKGIQQKTPSIIAFDQYFAKRPIYQATSVCYYGSQT